MTDVAACMSAACHITRARTRHRQRTVRNTCPEGPAIVTPHTSSPAIPDDKRRLTTAV